MKIENQQLYTEIQTPKVQEKIKKDKQKNMSSLKDPTISPFESILKNNSLAKDSTQEEKIQLLLEETKKNQQILFGDLSFENLIKYKKSVSIFLQYYVNHYVKIETQYSRNPKEFGKKILIIKEIEGKLITLAKNMINEQNSSLNILQGVGEIQGLVVNLLL